MHLHPRGPLSSALLHVLGSGRRGPDRVAGLAGLAEAAVETCDDLVVDEDVQLTLYVLNELHYSGNVLEQDGPATRGAPGGEPDPDWEWHPGLLAARQALATAFEVQLHATYERPAPTDLRDVPASLFAMARGDSTAAPDSDAPARGRRRPRSVASFVAREADLEQVREILVLRSPYQLKEADPHTFAIPRLRGRAKAALVEVQADEYGGGVVDRMHQELFARTMRSVGLDDRPNGYLDVIPAVVLAGVNALSLFALHRRLRGALCGHLAAFEMTSSLPAKRYVAGLQRLGLGRDAWQFFDEHIEADAVHEQIVANDVCGGLLEDEPGLAPDVLLGASVCLGLDARITEHVLDAYAEGRSALRSPLPRSVPTALLAEPVPVPLHLLRDDRRAASADDAATAAG
jgi:hypothetical protein